MNHVRYGDIIGGDNPLAYPIPQGHPAYRGQPQHYPQHHPQHMSGPQVGNWGPGWNGGPFFGAEGDPNGGYGGYGGYAPPAPINSPALAIGPGGSPLALRKPLGLSPKCIPAGECATLQAVSQELFKPQLFILPKRIAVAVTLTDMKAGIQPLFASADGEIPGEAFIAEAENVTFNGWTVLPNQPIFVTFRNDSNQDLVVKGAFWGWVASGNMLHLYGPNFSNQHF